MARRVSRINLPGIQIPPTDVSTTWQYQTFLYYGDVPVVDTYFFWRELSDGMMEPVSDEDSTLSTQEVGDESSTWSGITSAEFSTVETGDSEMTWTKLTEFYDKSGED